MKLLYQYNLILLTFVITSCSSTEAMPSSTLPIVSVKTETHPTTAIQSTTAPTQMATTSLPVQGNPTFTSTIRASPVEIIRYEPLDIMPSVPSGTSIRGSLILIGLGNNRTYRLDFTQNYEQDFPETTYCWSVSPDSRWLAYCQHRNDLPAKDWLIIESSDGKQVNELPIGKNWNVFLTLTWLDNQRLVFNLEQSDSQSILPIVIVNPFTGEQQEIASDYPDLKPMISGPSGTLHFVFNTVVYHPSLNLVIYPQTTEEGFFIVLWNRQTKQVLARIKDLGGFGRYPIWSPDMEKFIVAVIHQGGKQPGDFSTFIEELFSVTQEGGIQQLTHFGENFDNAEIGLASWSPDGKRLAFWLTTSPSMCGEGPNLAVIEIENRNVTNYCVPTYFGDAPLPIWSPDGKCIAVESRGKDGLRVILMNLEQAWAAQIADNAYPIGWLGGP